MIPYGLHRQDGLVFLHERGGGRCVSPGLADAGLKTPFRVTVPHYLRCPHRFADPEPGPILDHPFVRAMGPDQEGGLFHVRPVHVNWIWRLSAMIQTDERFVDPYYGWAKPRIRRLLPRLTVTNAAPLCIIELDPGDINDMAAAAIMPRTRNFIMSGPIKLPEATLLDPEGLDWNHDWQAEGRRQLHHLIRRS